MKKVGVMHDESPCTYNTYLNRKSRDHTNMKPETTCGV